MAELSQPESTNDEKNDMECLYCWSSIRISAAKIFCVKMIVASGNHLSR